MTAARFTEQNLYGPTGPIASDIRQDVIGDCFFVATLAAVARQNPNQIRAALAYDKTSQNFVVRLFDASSVVKYIHVTQKELANNIVRQGGSQMDNRRNDQRAWPAVIETAYAKMHDSNSRNGLGEGYNIIGAGGWPKDAMMAITGFEGSELKYAIVPPLTRSASIQLLGSRVALALKQKKSVTLWSVVETDNRTAAAIRARRPVAQDGLVDNHVYTVLSVKQAVTGAWTVNLRNPWGTNIGVGEGRDAASPNISVLLQTLVDTGGLNSFRLSNERIR
jgi:Calpain family cysteine protease